MTRASVEADGQMEWWLEADYDGLCQVFVDAISKLYKDCQNQ
jgi:hypothetical protein